MKKRTENATLLKPHSLHISIQSSVYAYITVFQMKKLKDSEYLNKY
ncbi:MAG: hypothetical protein IJ736_15820 [Firmicutes bacterium]|nr:hypothetical protein [Bacillota bacterium]